MHTALLRLGKRQGIGVIYFNVPGAPNRARLTPPRLNIWDNAWGAFWPARDRNGEWLIRGARLDWHRPMVKHELQRLIADLPAPSGWDVLRGDAPAGPERYRGDRS